jgi:hypothetical protein
MSDLISNLILRNRDMPSPDILQPRLPSLFEASNRVEGLSDQVSTQTESGSESSFPVSAVNRINLSPSEDATSPVGTNSIQGSSSISSSLNSSHLERPLETRNFYSMLARQEIGSLTSPNVSDGNPLDNETLSDMNRRRIETVIGHENQIIGRKSSKDSQRMDSKSMAHVISPRVKSVTTLPDDAQKSETRNPLGRRSLEKPSNVISLQENVMEAEPPVVQIHIGRIEVRAATTTPVTPVTKAAPAQPRMTLDDYLRQREGRR